MTDFWLFLGAVVVLLATPGPTNTLLYAGGALHGVRRSLPLLAEELGGYLIATTAIAYAIGPLLTDRPTLALVAKILLAAYLAFIAVRLWQMARHSVEVTTPASRGRVFVTTLLNPKAIVFALAIIPFNKPEALYFIPVFVVTVLCAGFSWVLFGALSGSAADGRYRVYAVRAASVALCVFAGLILTASVR